MQLTHNQADEILKAHILLDGFIGNAEGSGEARVKIAHNLSKLRQVAEVVAETKKKLFNEFAPGKTNVSKDDPIFPELARQMDEIGNTQVEVKLYKIPYDKLKAQEISPAVLSTLSDLIAGMPSVGEPDA